MVLIVIGCVLVPVSLVAVWTHNEVSADSPPEDGHASAQEAPPVGVGEAMASQSQT